MRLAHIPGNISVLNHDRNLQTGAVVVIRVRGHIAGVQQCRPWTKWGRTVRLPISSIYIRRERGGRPVV